MAKHQNMFHEDAFSSIFGLSFDSRKSVVKGLIIHTFRKYAFIFDNEESFENWAEN